LSIKWKFTKFCIKMCAKNWQKMKIAKNQQILFWSILSILNSIDIISETVPLGD